MTSRHYCPACGGGLVSEPKSKPLHCTRCDWRLITLAEWNKLPPFGQGYALYMQANWPTSPLAKAKNPYAEGTRKYKAFEQGEQRAYHSAQDGEE
jgi:hypothetical protein